MSKSFSSARKESVFINRINTEKAKLFQRFDPAVAGSFVRKPLEVPAGSADKSYVDTKLNLALKQRLLENFAGAGEGVQTVIAALPVDYSQVTELGYADYIEKNIQPHLAEAGQGIEDITRLVAGQQNEKIKDLLQLDIPLSKNPLFTEEMRVSRVHGYSRISRLPAEKISAAIQSLHTDPFELEMEHYEKLVQDQVITVAEKDQLHLVMEMAKLTGDHLPLVEALQTARVSSVRELASWDKNDWLDLMNNQRIAPPPGEDTSTYIDAIRDHLALSFPSYSLLQGMGKQAVLLTSTIQGIVPLLTKNPKLLQFDTDTEIDWEGVRPEEKVKLKEELSNLRNFVSSYRYLGLPEILADTQMDLAGKQGKIEARIRSLELFSRQNPKVDLQLTNFFDAETTRSFNWNGIDEDQRGGIRRQLMASQRVLLLAPHPAQAQQLLSGGFDSAGSIVDAGPEAFQQRSRLGVEEAKEVFAKASETMMMTSHVFEAARLSLKDTIGNKIGPANWAVPDYTNQLKEIDGFDELFGSQDYCDCAHCRSIFSPAAYFTDLMYFIQKNVSDKVFASRPKHALYLRNRRPDLWKLELSCENTNTLIPYLDVVNKVLEEYLKRALSVTDVYKQLQTEQISFNLPFNLYLEELRIYLSHFSLTLAQVFQTLQHTPEEIWRERILLSPEEWTLIDTPALTNAVRKRIGDPNAADFAKFSVKDFIRFAGITRTQLDVLLAVSFSKQLTPINIIKEQSTDPVTDPLINYVEKMTGLTNEGLDLIHRFIRLWKKTGWTMRELDMLLVSLKAKGLVPVSSDADQNVLIGKEVMITCSKLLAIQTGLKFKVEELPCLYGALPDKPLKEKGTGFFTRTFTDKLMGSANSINFHHSFINNDGITDPRLGSLLGGLGISEGELVRFFTHFTTVVNFDGSGNTNLTREAVSLFYLHARLAKALRYSIEDLLLLFQLHFSTGNPWVDSIDRVFELMAFKTNLQTTKFKVPDLWFILQGEEKGSALYKITSAAIHPLVHSLQVQQAIYFDATVFSGIPALEGDLPQRLIDQLVLDGLAVKKSVTENSYRLTAAYQLNQNFAATFTAISAPPAVTAQEPAIRSALSVYHAKVILRDQLTKLLNLTPDLYTSLLPFITTADADAAMYSALYTSFDTAGNPITPADLLPLENFVKEIERLLHLFGKADCREKDILFLAAHPSVAGITNPALLTVEQLAAVAGYKKFIGANPEKTEALQSLLVSYQSSGVFSNDELVLLADTLRTDPRVLGSVVRSVSLPATAIAAVRYLQECLAICTPLGINGESLVQLKAGTFAELKEARDIVMGSFAAKYPEEKERIEKLEPYHDKVNTKKRDALCDFILAHNKELKFKDKNDLYAYFLLDVEMSGCFRTSWLVAANSSLQLYIHRCLMNLEQAASATLIPDGNNDPDDDAYEFVRVKPDMIPQDEWAWRKNYRVWEANRKVFLYPENYILPELRDNKSPLFKELEDELLQQKVTRESAESAYKKYLAGFADLAKMKISGSYFHEASNSYYFFARTHVEPPEFYFRQWKGQKTWTPWEKIELAISSTHVSATIYAGKLYLFWTEISTEEENSVSGGSSSSAGFNHKLYIRYSFLDENKKWSAPQRFFHSERIFGADLTINEVMNRKTFPGQKDGKLYNFYSDADYTASIAGHRRIDLFNNKMIGSDFTWIPSSLLMPSNTDLINLKKTGSSVSLIAVKSTYARQESRADDELTVTSSPAPAVTSNFDEDIYQPELGVAGNKFGEFIFRVANQQYLIKLGGNREPGGNSLLSTYLFSPSKWKMIRLSTSLPDKLGEKLFMQGLEKFLGLSTQEFKEDVLPFTINDTSVLGAPYHNSKHIDFTGSYGEYYWELFFHIPFLIAGHQNANQQFKEADWWYRKIFDPTSADFTNPPKDRCWQFIAFRGVTIKTLQQILTDAAAIEAYKKDPFNPHAIARLRLNAYQKTIVMKYIDNLLDWGDHLFAQDTMESINEATMLYVMAYDILGKRPVQLGKCNTAPDELLTYEKLGPAIDKGSEFLIQLENFSYSFSLAAEKYKFSETMVMQDITKSFVTAATQVNMLGTERYKVKDEVIQTAAAKTKLMMDQRASYEKVSRYEPASREKLKIQPGYSKAKDWEIKPWKPPHIGMIRQKVLAFCIPHNEELLKYWDRVEDRLFKIRNCMNISGVRRQLALFQPPIDPMLLVKARAAGLSLEDILSAMNKPLPYYRFIYLLEKARQLTQTVQSFGSSLLSALEKKDVEELTLIRTVNEKEILDLTTQIKKQSIQESQHQSLSLQEQEKNIQLRITYYSNLLENGLTGWEITQQVSRHVATGIKIAEGGLHLLTGIYYLIPNAGSPFAMTYGGEELGNSGAEFAQWTNSLASVASSISDSAGLEATFQRREEEWQQQLDTAQQELKVLQRQILAADIKVSIHERDLEIHLKGIEHNKEMEDFYKNKFTNLGLYNYLATTLTRLYRESYNVAYDVAKMAEQAYQFERDDDTVFIAPDNWQFDKAGLLAGEKLLLQLQRLEKNYLVNNRRDYEISQRFSMQLLAPDKLTELRQKGSCSFDIPELAYDLYYPGQYKRIIKAVSLTIPCITGSFSNVSCKLSLLDSKVRKEPSVDTDLLSVPVQKLTSIATSTAQNDSGVFELNFRDERYLPFEGAGAISTWRLELPNKVRSFDYTSIADVIFQVSYVAKDDGAFKEAVELNIETAITDHAAANGLYRLFSLRGEFPDAFHRLLNTNATPQKEDLVITKQHFPYVFADKDLSLVSGTIYLKQVKGSTITTGGLSIKLNSFTASAWADFPNDGSVDPVFILKEGAIALNGDPVKKWTLDAGNGGLKKEEVEDVLILMKYTIV